MLYLIKARNGNVKIGHVRDPKTLSSRIRQYNEIEPLVELLDSCDGTVELERRLHNILWDRGLAVHGEWFKDNPLIHKIWSMAKSKKWKPRYLKWREGGNYDNAKRSDNDTIYDMYLYDFRDVPVDCYPLWDGSYTLQGLRLGASREGRNKRLAKQK